MKGLLLKDYYVIRSGLLLQLIMVVFLGISFSFMLSPWVCIVVAATSLSAMTLMTIQSDTQSLWDKYEMTMPLSQPARVSCKYLLYALMGAVGLAVGALVGSMAAYVKHSFSFDDMQFYMCIAIYMSLLPGSISIPIMRRLPMERSIMGMVLAYIAASLLIAAAVWVMKQFADILVNINLLFMILAGLGIAAYTASWLISAHARS